MEQDVNLWLSIPLVIFLSGALMLAGMFMGRFAGKTVAGLERDNYSLKRHNEKLDYELQLLQIRFEKVKSNELAIGYRWLENMRTLRFSQRANERHKRANKRLRSYLDAANAWPVKPRPLSEGYADRKVGKMIRDVPTFKEMKSGTFKEMSSRRAEVEELAGELLIQHSKGK